MGTNAPLLEGQPGAHQWDTGLFQPTVCHPISVCVWPVLHFSLLKRFCHCLSPFDNVFFFFFYYMFYLQNVHTDSDTSVPTPIIHLPSLPFVIPPPSSHAFISRSMCLSCCLWCVCSLTWLDSSCAVREPSWCPV